MSWKSPRFFFYRKFYKISFFVCYMYIMDIYIHTICIYFYCIIYCSLCEYSIPNPKTHTSDTACNVERKSEFEAKIHSTNKYVQNWTGPNMFRTQWWNCIHFQLTYRLHRTDCYLLTHNIPSNAIAIIIFFIIIVSLLVF